MNKRNKAVSEGIGDESIEEKAAARILNLGLDLHYRQVSTGMQEDWGSDYADRENVLRARYQLPYRVFPCSNFLVRENHKVGRSSLAPMWEIAPAHAEIGIGIEVVGHSRTNKKCYIASEISCATQMGV